MKGRKNEEEEEEEKRNCIDDMMVNPSSLYTNFFLSTRDEY